MTRRRSKPAPRESSARAGARREAPSTETVVESLVGVWIGRAASAAVIGSAIALACRKLGDFDTWWHLAAGRWIVMHRSVPATDTLSHTVRDHPWINLQWGFDVAIYLLHSLGGPALLSLAGAVVFAAAIGLVLGVARAHLGNTIGALLGLLVVVTAQERVLLRPELLSFLLLAAVLAVLESARDRDGRGLFLLVPLMVVWVNVHALFAVGAFAIVSALVGAGRVPSRRALAWSGAALASVLINPFWLTGALFPLKLLSRINGSDPVFQSVGEFASPFTAGANDVSTIAYKVTLSLGALAAVAAWISSRRSDARSDDVPRFDWGGALLFAGLALVSVAARRNIAVFAIGTALFMARCLAAVLAARAPLRARVARGTPVVGVVVTVSALLLAASAVAGAFYKWDREPQEFGGGAMEGSFPVRAAAFARAAKLPPALYNDMLGGGYLAWDDPLGGGVFVDGRLEVYDTPFLTEYVAAMSDAVRWQADADRYGVQTAIIAHRSEADRELVGRLFHGDVWALVYGDEVAAVFVRRAGNGAAIARATVLRPEWDARTSAWLARPAERWPYPAGRVEGTRAYARFLATIGSDDAAVAAYLKYLDLGVVVNDEVETRLLLARYFTSHGRTAEAQDQVRRILRMSPQNAEARALLR